MHVVRRRKLVAVSSRRTLARRHSQLHRTRSPLAVRYQSLLRRRRRIHCKKYPYIHACDGPVCSLFRRIYIIQTYTEPIPLKYGKRATKYPWIYGYFYSVKQRSISPKLYVHVSPNFISTLPVTISRSSDVSIAIRHVLLTFYFFIWSLWRWRR